MKIVNNRWFINKRMSEVELREAGVLEAKELAEALEGVRKFPVEIIIQNESNVRALKLP